MVLTSEERVWLVKHVFQEGDRYTAVVRQRFAEKFPDKPVSHHNAVVTLLISFKKQDQCMMPNAVEGQQSYRRRNCWTFLAVCCRVHQNHYKN